MDIKKLRLEKGFTQNYMAKKIGVSIAAYLKWEYGIGKPNEDNLKKLKEVLGIK